MFGRTKAPARIVLSVCHSSIDIVSSLLNVISTTNDFPRPNYPVVPCGSSSDEVWCHSLASRRKQHKDKTIFEALSEQLLLSPADQVIPVCICQCASASVGELACLINSRVVDDFGNALAKRMSA